MLANNKVAPFNDRPVVDRVGFYPGIVPHNELSLRTDSTQDLHAVGVNEVEIIADEEGGDVGLQTERL